RSGRPIRRAGDESLRRLRTDRIDLYQMHHVDRDTPWDEVWQAMEQLVTAGKVIYVGSSNFAGWHIAQANAVAAERHFLGLVSEQSLQPQRANRRARGDPGLPGPRPRSPALEPARGRAARGRARGGGRGTPGERADPEAGGGASRAARGLGGLLSRAR